MNEEKGMYILKEDAVHAIEEWAKRNEEKAKCQPSRIAKHMATIVETINSAKVEPIITGELLRDFTGVNISYGKCGNCGENLMWYTKNKINGCPYCFVRFGSADRKQNNTAGRQNND